MIKLCNYQLAKENAQLNCSKWKLIAHIFCCKNKRQLMYLQQIALT